MSVGDTQSLRSLAIGAAILGAFTFFVSLGLRAQDLLVHTGVPLHLYTLPLRSRASPRMARAPDFPAGFVFGVATAAYQIEGAAREGGRRPSIWDTFAETPGKVANGDTGLVACDHYHRYKADVGLIRELGVGAYRFSIAWPRILPLGTRGAVNDEGVAFYNALLDELLAAGVTPVVTLYHWDLPQAVHDDTGGWADPGGRVADEFAAYARVCFEKFGHRVKQWITLNEPWCSSVLGYANGEHAPGKFDAPGVDPYRAAHNLLRAHAKAVAVYRSDFQRRQGGVIGVTLNVDWGEPMDDSEASKAASTRYMSFNLGWFADPVYKGDYPAIMRSTVGERLPVFTPEEKRLLKGSSDFFGLNSYSTHLVSRRQHPGGHKTDSGSSFWTDEDIHKEANSSWPRTDMGWAVYPRGLRSVLGYIHTTYKPAGGILITENGLAAHEPDLVAAKADTTRVAFYRGYIGAVADALRDGVDVRGYFLWSFMDNFEWAYGYSKRFGLYFVDYHTQERTAKPAVSWYRNLIKKRRLPDS